MRFGEEFGGDFEGVIRGGDAAVNGRVEENFLDFFARDAVVQSGTKMKAKFVLAIEGDGHGRGRRAAGGGGEAGAGQNLAPAEGEGKARVRRLRVWRERPGRDQISPQA